jgi:hypothetical protein
VKWIRTRSRKELDTATTLYQKYVTSSVILLRFFCDENKRFKLYTGAIFFVEFRNGIHVRLGLRVSFYWFFNKYCTWSFYIFAVFLNMCLLLCVNGRCIRLKFLICRPFIQILCCVLSKVACDHQRSFVLCYLYTFIT